MKQEILLLICLNMWWLVIFEIGLPFTRWILAFGIGWSIGYFAFAIIKITRGIAFRRCLKCGGRIK